MTVSAVIIVIEMVNSWKDIVKYFLVTNSGQMTELVTLPIGVGMIFSLGRLLV